jgi:hypothetical protein
LSEVVAVVQGDLVALLEAVAVVDKLFIYEIMDSVYQHIALLLVQGARKIYQDHRLYSMTLQQQEVGKVTEETVAQEAVDREGV